jgi:exonuclease VII large subunit
MAQAKKTATRTARKPAVKRKPTPKRAAPKKTAPTIAATAQDTGRNVYLAGLGFYGKAYDQAQEQLDSLQKRLEQRRKKADKLYKELVKRGEKLEKDAKGAIQDIELPKLELENLTDRKKLEQQLKKAKARFAELRKSVGFKAAA